MMKSKEYLFLNFKVIVLSALREGVGIYSFFFASFSSLIIYDLSETTINEHHSIPTRRIVDKPPMRRHAGVSDLKS